MAADEEGRPDDNTIVKNSGWAQGDSLECYSISPSKGWSRDKKKKTDLRCVSGRKSKKSLK